MTNLDHKLSEDVVSAVVVAEIGKHQVFTQASYNES
jgi:hypothetical protein